MTLELRMAEFRKEVLDIGGTIYTKQMLDRFIALWTEPNRAKKPKMRFELEKTWKISLRLATWAKNNYDDIECYLTDAEKTIEQKKREFIKALDPFLKTYDRDILNGFYRHWGQPENKRMPMRLRWECEKFWDLKNRLATWALREEQRKENGTKRKG